MKTDATTKWTFSTPLCSVLRLGVTTDWVGIGSKILSWFQPRSSIQPSTRRLCWGLFGRSQWIWQSVGQLRTSPAVRNVNLNQIWKETGRPEACITRSCFGWVRVGSEFNQFISPREHTFFFIRSDSKSEQSFSSLTKSAYSSYCTNTTPNTSKKLFGDMFQWLFKCRKITMMRLRDRLATLNIKRNKLLDDPIYLIFILFLR